MEFPDAWVIIVDGKDGLLRIFAQHRADGFSAGMYSRISSGFGLKDIKDNGGEYMITQQSGKCYSLRKDDEGIGNSFMRSRLDNLLDENTCFKITKISIEMSKLNN